MNKANIQAEIAEYRELLNDPQASDLSKELAREEIADLEGKLAELDSKGKPGMAEKPAATKQKRGPKPGQKPGKRPKSEHPAYNGPAEDKNGDIIKKGDFVWYTDNNGKTFTAEVINLKRHQGGGHQIKYKGADGKWKTPMAQPKQIVLSKPGVKIISTDDKIPQNLIDEAYAAGRNDCEDNKVVLVTPKEKTQVKAPMQADPANGDVIVVNKQGHPMYVATKEAVDADYKKDKKQAKTQTKKGKVTAFLETEGPNPAAAAAPAESDDKRPYKSVKPAKPHTGCKGTQEKSKSPALMLFLEGMRQKWHSGENLDKITRVLFDNDRKKLVVEIDSYNAIDWNVGYRYYDICPESGRMTKVDKNEIKGASVLMNRDATKEFYRHPYSSSCARVSKALYVECYKNGACDTDQKKRLYGIFAGKCSKEISLGQEYSKHLHKIAGQRWKGPKSGQSYAQVFKAVALEARKGN